MVIVNMADLTTALGALTDAEVADVVYALEVGLDQSQEHLAWLGTSDGLREEHSDAQVAEARHIAKTLARILGVPENANNKMN